MFLRNSKKKQDGDVWEAIAELVDSLLVKGLGRRFPRILSPTEWQITDSLLNNNLGPADEVEPVLQITSRKGEPSQYRYW